jgi:hypothetical protein
VTIIEEEATIVREIFAQYLDGVSPRQITQALATRGEVTTLGNLWQPHTVRGITHAPEPPPKGRGGPLPR